MRCLNWKVIATLAGVGVVIYALAPGVAAAAVPLLILAVCPFSMLLMMRTMGSMGSCARQRDTGDGDEVTRLRAEVDALHAERQSRQEATWER